MARDLAFSVERYAELVESFPREDEAEEVIYTFLYRDEIHDAVKEGAKLSARSAELLDAADRKLLSMHADLARRFPDVFGRGAPAEYWWWHLDKGPQVREDAWRAA